MDKKQLYDLCFRVRNFLEQVPNYSDISFIQSCKFPYGCCDDASQILGTLIYEEFCVIPHLVRAEGSEKSGSHVWLEVSDFVIDITLDQFNDSYELFEFPPIYIGGRTIFHSELLEGGYKIEPDSRHYSGCAKNILQSDYEIIKKNI